MSTLDQLIAREVLDSRGHPTLEVEVRTSSGARGRAGAATGGSVGRHEARELRDREPRRHGGRGVRKAVALVAAEVAPALRGLDLADQRGLDEALIALDATADRSRLGANTTLAVSLAAARAVACDRDVPLYAHLGRLWGEHLPAGHAVVPSLPLPMAHMISGAGRHGRTLDFQDILMVPVGARDFAEALAMVVAVHHALGTILHHHGHESHLVGEHGGYGPRLRSDAQAVDHLLAAVLAAGMEVGRDVAVALDVAAAQLLDADATTYNLAVGREAHDADAMIAMLEHWTRQYPIVSIEDGLGDDDWDGWAALTARLGGRIQVAGDDLFASQADRIGRAGWPRPANAVVIKPGQVGTLTQTLEAMAEARRQGHRLIIAARAGETEDTTLADLAVATGAEQVKLGGVSRAERVVKYNRLLRIEEELGAYPRFAGGDALAPRGDAVDGHPGPDGALGL